MPPFVDQKGFACIAAAFDLDPGNIVPQFTWQRQHGLGRFLTGCEYSLAPAYKTSFLGNRAHPHLPLGGFDHPAYRDLQRFAFGLGVCSSRTRRLPAVDHLHAASR